MTTTDVKPGTCVADIIDALTALGVSDRAAYQITRHTLAGCLRDAADMHNCGRLAPDMPRPGDDTIDALPDDLRDAAAAVMFALVRAARVAGGVEFVEVGLPMAYAAQAVIHAVNASR